MKRMILCLFAYLFLVKSYAQKDIKDFIKQNTHPIQSISSDSTNFEDLEVIGNSINNARIVLLGEQDHGDAATFLAKSRLIKYLHEKKGFRIIAFESDYFALNEGWSSIDKNKLVIDSFLKSNILSLWSYCDECNELLFNYIPFTHTTKNHLEVTGFDNQMVYSYSRNHLISKLDSVLVKLDLPITKQTNYKSEVLGEINDLITKFWYKRPPDSSFEGCNMVLQLIREQLQEKGIIKDDFWYSVIDNLISFNQETLKTTRFITNQTATNNIRDRQMYLNLKWLAENKYPNDKIIVWAANLHVAKDGVYDKKYTTMGELLSKDSTLAKSIYSIGFTSFNGVGGRMNSKKIYNPEAPDDSFEGLVAPISSYSFTDFKNYNILFPSTDKAFEMRGWYYKFFKTNWNKVYDGVFFINEMYRCK